MSSVLIIDDDLDLRNGLKNVLSRDYNVIAVENVMSAKKALTQHQFDLILLDLELPDGNGLELCAYIKNLEQVSEIPILIISGKLEISTKIAGFELGAEDYIVKPFHREELIARVRAKLRTAALRRSKIFTKGSFRIDEQKHKIFVNKSPQEELNLSPTEFKLLVHFIQNDGQIFTRDQLISVCKGAGYAVTDRSIDTHIYSLRKKIDENAGVISTHYGTGYSFEIKQPKTPL